MTYDGADHYVVLFGGLANNGSALSDTWTYHARVWTHLALNSSQSPPARAFASIAYDRADGVVVLFGGLGTPNGTYATRMNDTWEFHAGNWTKLPTSVAPRARFAASMAYDAADRYLLLFGGNSTMGAIGDCWTFRAGVWTHLSIPTPTSRSGAAMTYSFGYHSVVLIAGVGLHSTDSPPLNWTWLFNGGTWKHTVVTRYWAEPRLRFGAGFASSQNTTLLVGGSESATAWGGSASPFYFGCWCGGNGTQLARWTSQLATAHPGPPTGLPDRFPGFVWDASDGYFLYLFDGLTWVTHN